MMLIVETPAGVLIREIPNAMQLRTDVEPGTAAEEAVHDAAAIWGLPDFVGASSPSVRVPVRLETTC